MSKYSISSLKLQYHKFNECVVFGRQSERKMDKK